MRAWRKSENGFREIDAPVLAPAADQVRIAVEAVEFGEHERAASPDLIPGGAAVGRVVAWGEAASHLAHARVLLGPAVPCGECDVCRRGAAAICPRGQTLGQTVDGAMAAEVLASARWVCPLDDELDVPGPRAAAIPGALALAFAMVARAGVGPGDAIAIADDELIARLVFQIAVERGTSPLIISDDAEFRTAVSRAGGRAIPRTAGEGDALLETARAAAAELQLGERPWKIFAASANAYRLGLQWVGPGTTMILGGDGNHAVDVPLGRLASMGATVLGVPRAHPDLLTEAAALVATKAIELDALVELRSITDTTSVEGLSAAHGRALVLTLDD